MLFSITRQHGAALARSAAVLVIGGVAASCNSGASSLTDGLTTNSTGPQAVAQADQPYPGDRVLRPKEPVGVEVQNSPVAAGAPGASAAPVYDAPTASTLPPPSGTGGARSAVAPASSAGTVERQPNPATGQTEVAQLPQAPKAPESRDSRSDSISGSTYSVVSGDTLYSISRRSGVSVDRIQQANGISDGAIRVGQKLTIPGAATVAAATPSQTPRKETTASAPADKEPEAQTASSPAQPTQPSQPEKTVEPEPSDEQVAALTPQSTGVDRLRWPVRGRVVSNFGASAGGRANDGIDIAVPEGTAVHAAENGVVIYAGDGLKGFGNTVLVRHEDGLVTVYGHTSDMKVKRGDKVRRGQEIALSGMTGDADRPKLHFEVRKGTNPVDPTTYLD